MGRYSIPGINIQWPISSFILSGHKIIETRTYPLPDKYLDQELALIETPGRKGKFKARIVAIVVFSHPFQYHSRDQFYEDYERHRVDKQSDWRWTSAKRKWGWPLKIVKKFDPPIPLKKRTGIIFTKQVALPND